MDIVELSRLQFAYTAMIHFLFVPLTLGLSFILAIMESVYVMTGRQIYRDMTRFWGKLFGINFALGVTTGLAMEFQFGTNWSYYSHYVGDIFGAPLAIEALMAFFLESTLVGLFFFGWDRMSRVKHLAVTWLMALATNLSALWILVANGWMQYPIGSEFNIETMRMELTSFAEVLLNPVAQVKFVHTVSAGYVTGAVFVLAISSWYLLKGRDLAFARRSFAIASAFGLAAALSVIVLGDESGYALGDVQKVKLAAIEAEWETHPAPAAFTLFGFPNQETRSTDYAVRIPAIMGLIATRSTDQQVDGFDRILEHNLQRIIRGQEAYQLMTRIRAGEGDEQVRARFEALRDDLGYGLLLSVYAEDVANASDAEIAAALDASIPRVWPLFWTFRIMVACGFLMLVIFAFAFWHSARRTPDKPRWLLRLALFSLPLPWIASEAGWFVAEYGRQPWAIGEILPTSLAVSSLTAGEVLGTLAAIVVLYSIFLIIEVWLMVRFARKGPSSLHTGRYDLETGKLKEA
ncbi:cytochrome d ubiquinol oxidase subunit I [Halopseudomonas formosensis]|jgi:cytochrome d ubiquinol oxidase subunit I|uniref:Cytochrome d ubiquinol oxidase subunit I n=1 Tax=Halopseudomonas formosensis TaxID=1002526 RepID=A0A1I6BNQ9_9GAMM|nr:cytochrome ubiquinol oxidase subunit I [Halopseudomonas formosensis]SFQ82590.1 cytochrome d ubiquinol oxidase subunit I [Halopseudomonas formosensis]